MQTLRAMARAVREPRHVVLLLVLLAAAAVFARLGLWQLDRAAQQGEAAAAVEAAAAAELAPLAEVLSAQTTFTSDLVGRHVQVEGTFEADQLLVVDRVHAGERGSWVLTPFRVADTGAVLAVVRGWGHDELPDPPEGGLTVTGWLQAGEAAGTAGLAEGTTDAVSPAELVNRWGGPTYTAYLVLDSPPQDGLVQVDRPVADAGLEWRNLAYALQWWLFGIFAVLLWWRLVKDDDDVLPRPRSGGDVEIGAS